jgi:hypothetical protein
MKTLSTCLLAAVTLGASSPSSAQTLRAARTLWATDAREVPALAREVDSMMDAGLLRAFGPSSMVRFRGEPTNG